MAVLCTLSQPDSVQFLDFSGLVARQSSQLLDGEWSFIDKVYNRYGRENKISQPYKITTPVVYDLISYDDLGRKSRVLGASGLTTTFVYSSGKLSQSVTGFYSDEASSVVLTTNRSEQFNGLGETINSTDDIGGITRFEYNTLGLAKKVTGVDNVDTLLEYDIYGRRTVLDDTDKGLINYSFNALGEETTRVAPDGITKSTYRNSIGQIIKVNITKGANSDWDYFNYQNSPLIHSETNGSNATSYFYDNYHRLNNKQFNFDTKSWSQSIYYDEYGRLFRDVDISGDGRGMQFQYQNGILDRVFELSTGKAYYRATEMDARSNIISYTLGEGIGVNKDYDIFTGYLRQLYADAGAIQHQEYRYDQLGNLRYRSNNNAPSALVEHFSYDALNRLEDVYLDGQLTQSMSYLSNGNILTKSDVESGAFYQYATTQSQCSNTAGSHALVSIGSNRQYCYDARGNQTKAYKNGSLDREVTYSNYDKPLNIWSTNGQTTFNYDANKNKYKRVDTINGKVETTYYVGRHEIVYQTNGNSEIKRYIQDFAIHTIKNTGEESLNYVFNDHLGSGSVFTDENGAILHQTSFDAFGKRREPLTWGGVETPFLQLPNLMEMLSLTHKGFTGHQQVDHANLVHMGGRIYDPSIGRFVQADPIVQDARDAQSLNRYTYVYNNPLSYTDPTGYECDKFTDESCHAKMEHESAKIYSQKKEQAARDRSANEQNSEIPELINAAPKASSPSGGSDDNFTFGLACNACDDLEEQLTHLNPFLAQERLMEQRENGEIDEFEFLLGVSENAEQFLVILTGTVLSVQSSKGSRSTTRVHHQSQTKTNAPENLRTISVGENRAGQPQIKIKQSDGSIKIISHDRVKIDIPEARAKKGFRPQIFENPLPGSKGKKRVPTNEELKLLEKNTKG